MSDPEYLDTLVATCPNCGDSVPGHVRGFEHRGDEIDSWGCPACGYSTPRSSLTDAVSVSDLIGQYDGGDADPEGGAPLWRVEDQLTAAREAAQRADAPANRERVLTRIDEARALLTTSGLQDVLDEEVR
jgi:hypothetical protein